MIKFQFLKQFFQFSMINKMPEASQPTIQGGNIERYRKKIFAFIIYLSTAISHSIINYFNPLSLSPSQWWWCFCRFILYRNQKSIKFNFFCVYYCQTLINCQRDKNENCFISVAATAAAMELKESTRNLYNEEIKSILKIMAP